ncbi:MAG: extracellular solute-binding protein, partial [Clostridia bacterium]
MKKLITLVLCLCLLGSCATALADYTGKGPIAEEIVSISILGGNTTDTGVDAVGLPFYENFYKAAGVTPQLELLDFLTYGEAVKPRLAAGAGLADIVRLPDLDRDMAYVKSGLFIDLTDLYEKYGYNIRKALEQYGATDADLRTPDGKIYYIPMLSNASTLSHTLHLNVQWLKNLGLREPTTLDEYYDVLVAFRDNDANGNGDQTDEIPLTVKRADYLKLMGSLWNLDLWNGYHLDAEGNVQSSYASENYRAYLTYMNKLYSEGLLDPEFASNSTDILTNYCSQDRMGSMYGYTTDGYTMVKNNPNYTGDAIYLAMKPFSSEYSDGFYWSNDPINSLFGITRDCKDPENAFKFLDFCFSGRKQWTETAYDIALTCYHLPIALI